MELIPTLAELEQNRELHEGRLLVLLSAFSGRTGEETVDGLTKLAKLDFLLRYPVLLERALALRNAPIAKARVHDHERHSVESAMVRFRYGPWDHRYRTFVNLLVAKGLARVTLEGRTIRIGLTPDGIVAAKSLAESEDFSDADNRARALKQHIDLGATRLKDFVYEAFPEIVTMKWGVQIR